MAKNCHIHGGELQKGVTEIRRGMPSSGPPAGYFEAQNELFPNSKSFDIGGCLVGPGLKDERSARFCPECREAERTWSSEHGAEDFWRP